MNKDDKYKFVEESSSFLLEEEENESFELKEIDDNHIEASEQKRKKMIRKRNIIGAIIMTIFSGAVFVFGLFWQDKYDLMAICNSLWLVFAIELTMGWVLFVYNKKILAPLIHGTKTFGLMLVGKKPKKDYYDYIQQIETNPVPRFYYLLIFIFTLIIFIPALVLMIILM